MRQAGRYLPEYRAVRANAGGFLDLCFNPLLAAEVTLQPIRRFGFDAAILFSDILVIPHALGQKVDYLEGEGPRLPPLDGAAGLRGLSINLLHERLAPVYETVRRVAADLPDSTALIGFAGAPWTVACYMVDGQGGGEFPATRLWAYRDPAGFDALIDLLVEATIAYLSAQIDAGAEAVQLFDSWAGILSEEAFGRYVIAPTRRIVAALSQTHPLTPIIGFPRGAGLMLERYISETGVTALGIDTTVPTGWAASALQPRLPVQGNLDPLLLLAGGEAMRQGIRRIVDDLGRGPLIFNLGHGVLQQTPPEHVAVLLAQLRETP
jgi:uroporphyrinogen decarboxylase